MLGVDLGTTSCKSMIFSYDGNILGGSYTEYGLIIGKEGHIEQSTDIWWQNVKNSIKNSITEAGIDGRKIKALSISSQGISIVPVDKSGNALMNAISWLDGRAIEEAEAITCAYGAQSIFHTMGKPVLPAYVLPKLMWIKKNAPEIYKNTWKFMMGMDFLLYRLCGLVITDYSMASGTLCYSIAEKAWFNDIFSRFDIDRRKLPDIGCLGDIAGRVLPAVAEELGLSADCLAVIGAQDQRCASLGAGIDRGMATVSLGTATAICSICSEPVFDRQMKVTCCGFDKNRWMLESVIGTSGVALKWVKDTFFKDLPYSKLDDMASSSPAGSEGVMFYPYLENNGKGAKGAFTGLGLHITEGDIVRAVLEGIAYQIKIHIHSHEAINGAMRQIRLFGGGAKSDIWARIIADVTGKTIIIPGTHETANLGAAIIAGIGAKIYSNCGDAFKTVGAAAKTFITDPEKHKIYNEYYKAYCSSNEKIMLNS
ncbi:MAG: FGGY family carbohydrate kinase [Clostridiaceae bacterium]